MPVSPLERSYEQFNCRDKKIMEFDTQKHLLNSSTYWVPLKNSALFFGFLQTPSLENPGYAPIVCSRSNMLTKVVPNLLKRTSYDVSFYSLP